MTGEGLPMKSDSLNRWLTLIANLGVLAGLIIVAYEINQTRTQLQLSASADSTDGYVQAMQVLVQDADLSELIYRAELSYGDLEEFEKWRVSKYFDGFFVMAQQDYFVIRQNDVGETLVLFESDWRERLEIPAWREYWRLRRTRYAPVFRGFMDDIAARLDKR